jgi:hypothetical protein
VEVTSKGSTQHVEDFKEQVRENAERMKERNKTKTLKGSRKTKITVSTNNSNCRLCVTFRKSQKASLVRPDNADRNSQGTAASVNRGSGIKTWDKTMTGINLVLSDLECSG